VSGVVAQFSFNVGTRGWQVVSFVPWTLYLQRKRLQYVLNRGLVRPQNWSRHFGEKLLSTVRDQTRVFCCLHAVVTELSLLLQAKVKFYFILKWNLIAFLDSGSLY
jgi:hypothetical protein